MFTPTSHPVPKANLPSVDRVQELEASMREAWWRRGGQNLEQVFSTVAMAPFPRPSNVNEVRMALIRGESMNKASWTYPANMLGRNSDSGTESAALALRGSDHPLAPDLARHLVAVDESFAMLAAVEAGTATNGDFSRWSISRWGAPTDTATFEMLRSLEGVESGVDRRHSSDGAKDEVVMAGSVLIEAVERLLSQVAPGWQAQHRAGAVEMSVAPKLRTVFVDGSRQHTLSSARRLLVHEIGAHVTRTLNAQRYRDVLATVALGSDATATEEGLAVHLESALFVGSSQRNRVYAARAVAVAIALQAGIDEVYAVLRPLVGVDQAATIAVRVKRGVPHPGRPGAFTKDHVYLSGALKVEEALSERPGLLPLLFATKWGLDTVIRSGHLLSFEREQPDVPGIDLLTLIDDVLPRSLPPVR